MGSKNSAEYRFQSRRPTLEESVESLATHGLVIVDKYVGGKSVDRITDQIQPMLEKIRQQSAELKPGDELLEYDNYLISFGGRKYDEMYRYSQRTGKSIVSIRSRADRGMIDIFCIDKMFPDLVADFSPIQESWINEAASKASRSAFHPTNLNLYYNNSVTETRGFHVDNWHGNQLKAFVYLTDVVDDSDGPHLYVRGSHRNKMMANLNRAMNLISSRKHTDCPIIARNKLTKVIGKKGTMFASFQNGMHRGGPQEIGHERIVLVQNYRSD
jgi:hypothetical protein